MARSRFIMSSHCLCVETGRWRRPDPIRYERRYCASCRNKIEDEYHMLFECELYDELRNTLVPRYFRTRPSMFKLIKFINSASNKQIRGLAKFVYNAFKIRSNLVWPTENHSICAYTFELFMLLLTFCSCFVWFHALVTNLLPCWPCVFLSCLYISNLYGPVASKAIQWKLEIELCSHRPLRNSLHRVALAANLSWKFNENLLIHLTAMLLTDIGQAPYERNWTLYVL